VPYVNAFEQKEIRDRTEIRATARLDQDCSAGSLPQSGCVVEGVNFCDFSVFYKDLVANLNQVCGIDPTFQTCQSTRTMQAIGIRIPAYRASRMM
jgi:hypothetical protein